MGNGHWQDPSLFSTFYIMSHFSHKSVLMIYHKLSSALLGLLRSRFLLLLFLLWHHDDLKVQSMSCFHWRRLCVTTAWYVPFGHQKTIFSTKKRKPTGRQPKLMFRWILNLRKALVVFSIFCIGKCSKNYYTTFCCSCSMYLIASRTRSRSEAAC